MENKKTHKSVAEWKELVAEYQQPHLGRAIWQIVNTLGSVAVIWVTLYFTIGDILVANHWTFRSSGIIFGSFLHHIS